VLVMRGGRIVDELDHVSMSEEAIMNAAFATHAASLAEVTV
jgi:hypothetical protein